MLLPDYVNAKIKQIFEEKEHLENITIHLEPGTKAGDGYSAIMVRAQISGNKKGEPLSYDVMVKCCPNLLEARKFLPITAAFKREILFYENLSPVYAQIQEEANVPLEDRLIFAKCYGTCNEFGSEFLIMNNLKACGYTMINKTPLDYEHSALAITNLGKIHALALIYKERYPKEFNELLPQLKDILFEDSYEFECSGVFYYAEETYKKFLNNIKENDHKLRVEKAIGASLGKKLAKMSYEGNKKVIMHGDCWSYNMLFKYENGVPIKQIPLDFQRFFLGSMANDMLNFLGFGSEKELRKYFWKLVDVYYNSFYNFLTYFNYDANKFCTLEEFKKEVKDQIIYCLAMKIFSLPFFTSDEVFNAFEVLGKKIPESFYKITDEYVTIANDIVVDFIDFNFI